MKRRISLLLIILLLVPVLAVTAFAQQDAFVIDNAGLLTQDEEAALESTIAAIRQVYGMDIVILTEDSLNGKRPQEHADDFYDYNGYAEDGILYLLSMEEREWYISTCGNGRYVLTDYGIQTVGEAILGDLGAGNYYRAFGFLLMQLPDYFDAYLAGSPIDGYADYSGDYYHGDREETVYYEEDFTPSFFLSLIIGLVAALITVLIMRSSMKTGRRQRSAGVYLTDGSYHLNGHRDLYLYSNVTKIRKPENNPSGGGSSSHRSSSGRSHGGGGGKF